MSDAYEQHFLLQAAIDLNPRIIESPELYNFVELEIYAAIMDRLAQPLANGQSSPFSSQAPGSGHAIFAAVMTHHLGLLGHQMNHRTDKDWIDLFRLQGVEQLPPEYPTINLIFTRDSLATLNRLPAEVPLLTEIRSRYSPGLSAITSQTLRFSGDAQTLSVPARLSRQGSANLRPAEFVEMPRSLSFIESVTNDGTFLSPGRDRETLVETMLRAREGIRSGSLGRFSENGFFDPEADTFLGRCVTPRDFAYYALRLGAQKVNVLSGVQYQVPGQFNDLTTVIVYPASTSTLIFPVLTAMSLAERRIDVRGAEVIPLNGTIALRVVPRLTDFEVRQLAANAIAPDFDATKPLSGNNTVIGLNPPAGLWGDLRFARTIATVLENIDGVYAVPSVRLKHAQTDVPLEDLDIQPWNLLEVQSSIVLDISR